MPGGKAVWTRGLQFVGESSSGHGVIMDDRKESGGSDVGPSPVELALLGLAGCTGMDVVSILKKKRVAFTRFEVVTEGEVLREPYKHLKRIELVYRIWGDDIREKDLEHAIQLSKNKYCTLSNTLSGRAEIAHRCEINPGD